MAARIDLYTTSSASRIVFAVVGGFIGLVGLAFACAGVGFGVGAFGPDSGPERGGLFALCPAAVGALVAFTALFLVLKVIRGRARLEGSRVFIQGAFTTKSADLRTADISVNTTMHEDSTSSSQLNKAYTAVQSIIAKDRTSGQSVTLPIRRAGTATMPPEALTAVAEAITVGRIPTGQDDPALRIAARLLEFAQDPFV